MDGNNIIIEASNSFNKTILEERYLKLLDNAYCLFMDILNYSKVLIKIDEPFKQTESKEIQVNFPTAEEQRKITVEAKIIREQNIGVSRAISTKVKIFLLYKGYNVNDISDCITINISW